MLNIAFLWMGGTPDWLVTMYFVAIVFAAALALGVTASVSYSAGRRAESGKGKDLGAGDGL